MKTFRQFFLTMIFSIFSSGAFSQNLKVELTSEIQAGTLSVMTGKFSAASSLVSAGHCPVGEAGRRRQNRDIKFDKKFAAPPQVAVSFNGLDAGDSRNIRAIAYATSVTSEGANIVVETWCDTNLYLLEGSIVVVGSIAEQTQGRKVCSVYVPNMWRTTLDADVSWTVEDCKAVMPTVGANTYQLGCVFDSAPKWNLGGINGGAPSRNCGW